MSRAPGAPIISGMAGIGRIERLPSGVENDPTPVIAMVGEFDLSNAASLVEMFDELGDAGFVKVIVDMSNTSFIDSTVLGAFGLAYKRGLHLAIRGASAVVLRQLDVSGLRAIFDIS